MELVNVFGTFTLSIGKISIKFYVKLRKLVGEG